MRKLLVVGAFMLSTCFIYAQGTGGRKLGAVNLQSGSNGLGSSGYGSNNFMTFRNGEWVKDKSNEDSYSGSNYLFDSWSNKAEIYDLKGKGYKLINCNFNVASNRIEAMLDNTEDKTFVFNSRDISKIKIGDKYFAKKKIDNNPNYLLEVIQQGDKLALLKSYSAVIVPGNVNPMTQKKINEDKISINSSYYVERDGTLEEIKLKKSTVLKLMSDKKDKLKSFLSENKLSFKEDNDIKRIFGYYNSI